MGVFLCFMICFQKRETTKEKQQWYTLKLWFKNKHSDITEGCGLKINIIS